MKKVSVKVKNKKAKSALRRPYIAATILVAFACALLLTVMVKLPDQEFTENGALLNVSPLESFVPEELLTTPTPEAKETPKQYNATAKPAETAKPETEEETKTQSVGKFGEEKKITMIKPVEGAVLNKYSNGKPVKSKTMGDWRLHSGIDFNAEPGTVVKAPADGSVIRSETDTLTGYTISIDHGNGVVSTVYNLSETGAVSVGTKVKQGDKIGTAGETAKIEMLEDPHVHFEVTKNGSAENPEGYLR